MPKIKLIISNNNIFYFIGITSAIKNQTRVIEKNYLRLIKK